MNLPESVDILEVGPRDGLQNRCEFVETERKVELIRRLAAAGLGHIQLGAFVSPRAVPQFANIQEVARTVVESLPAVRFSALVPNRKGASDALACGVREISFVFSVTLSHNLSNVGKTHEQSLAELASIIELLPAYPEAEITADLATTFGCPFEFKVSTEQVLHFVRKAHELGVRRITLCDTVGYGNPRQVSEVIAACRTTFPDTVFRCHFHNTRGMGLANTLAAALAGVRSFDTAAGGLGGCPFAPGATGNVATEDMAFMFSEMGVETGADLPALLSAVRFLQEILPAAGLESALFRAGLPGKHAGPCLPGGAKT
ncbi:MAG: hydroxymethylglutaryl-CoA lyase [Deltaproteobacteria bacterium]|nr:hydroxymethylglutaryl-CoA lyase [Deltaproteobacteria bacterium]